MVKSARSKALSSLLGLLISAGVIVWLYYSIDWKEVSHQLANSHYWVLLPVSLFMVLHFVLRGMRWRWLLPGDESLTTRQLFDAIMVGTFANFILPLRAGEFIRPLLLTQQSNYSFSSGLVSVVIERFFDLSAVLLSFAVLVLFVPQMPDIVHQGASALTVLALALLAFMIIGVLVPKAAERLVDFFIDFLPQKARLPLKKFCHDFIEGAGVLREEGRLVKVLLFTAFIWLTNYLIIWAYLFVYQAPDNPHAQSFGLAVTVGVVLALFVAAPSAPGFIGVYQAGCIAGFALLGIDKEPATAFAIITHVYQYLFFGIYGVYFMISKEVSFGDLTRSTNQATSGS